MASVSASISVNKDMAAAMSQLADQMPTIIAGALFEEASTVMAHSQEVVPVLRGILKASGHVQPPEVSGRSVKVVLGYGGAAASYALLQHEMPPEVFSHREGQTWKYLERPMFEAAEGFSERVGGKIWSRMVRELT